MSKKGLTRLRLKGVAVVSFQRSEATNLDHYRKTASYPGDLRQGEVFLFLAKGMNQVIFIFPSVDVELDEDYVRGVLDSRRLRLDGGTWHPYMLQNYAKAVGIHLVGIKTFEQIYDEQRAEKRR